MATRKQVEDSYRKITTLLKRLQSELLRAQRHEIMDTTASDKYREENPLYPFYDMSHKIDEKFKKPIAKAVMDSIKYKKR